MNSLIHQARSLSNTGSVKSTSSKRPTREDRYILEQYASRGGETHKSLLTDIILDGVVFKKDRTSLTRSCNNMVSRSQFMLQTLENLANVMASIKYQLILTGAAFRDEGMLYDAPFPSTLRTWIEKNVSRHQSPDGIPPEFDEDVLKSLIGELILITNIRQDML